MATIKFFIQSKKNPATIYVSFSTGFKSVFKRKTDFNINPDRWSSETNFPKPDDENLKKLKTDLKGLATEIEKKLNIATAAGVEISGDWLQEQMDIILGKQKKTDVDRLTNYAQIYIDSLPTKELSNGRSGSSKATIQKYTALLHKIEGFETYKKKQY